ncbi:transposase [Alphaproteobacteria bacterium]|nr:transposase [Alphaproteobacteria bacterium]
MANKLKELIELAKKLPANRLDKAIEKLTELQQESEQEKKSSSPVCPKCFGSHIVRNGHKHNKQQYVCRGCGNSFCETTGSAIFHSHSGETVWKQVIKDTIEGISIEKTAKSLELHRETVFNMRHKILYCLEQNQKHTPKTFDGICEADETYFLESVKGKKIPENYHRKARRHGAKAQKRGISEEYVCVCAAVERDGTSFSMATNIATPSKKEILDVFGNRVTIGTLLLCDGSKNYKVLSETGKCVTANTNPDNAGLNNINAVNGYHSFMKERNRNARGFATRYLNRYNSLFQTTGVS